MTKEVATREVLLAVGVTVIPASLATPLCHQLFGAARTWPGSIQVGGSGEAAVTTRSSTTPNPPPHGRATHPCSPRGCFCPGEVLLSQSCDLSLQPLSSTSHGQLLDTEDISPARISARPLSMDLKLLQGGQRKRRGLCAWATREKAEQRKTKSFPLVSNPMFSQKNFPSGLFLWVQPRAVRGGCNTSPSPSPTVLPAQWDEATAAQTPWAGAAAEYHGKGRANL